MKTITLFLCLVLFTGLAFAQAPIVNPPKYILATTVGFDRYDSPRFKGGVSVGTAVANQSDTYLVLSYDVTSKYSTTIAELTRVIYHHPSGRASMFLLAGAGATTGGGNVSGAFDGGAGLVYKPFAKNLDFGIVGAARIKQLNGLGAYFAPTFGMMYEFR